MALLQRLFQPVVLQHVAALTLALRANNPKDKYSLALRTKALRRSVLSAVLRLYDRLFQPANNGSNANL